MTYTTEDLKANIRTHIPDFDMASAIMGMVSETGALKSRIAELEEAALQRIVSVGEMQTALERIAELEAMIAAKDDVFRKISIWEDISDDESSHDLLLDCIEFSRAALDLTPSEDALQAARQDGVKEELEV